MKSHRWRPTIAKKARLAEGERMTYITYTNMTEGPEQLTHDGRGCKLQRSAGGRGEEEEEVTLQPFHWNYPSR